MSGKLVAEVFEHAPQDLTSGQLLVYLALAEDARDADRQARFKSSIDDLAVSTRLTLGAVKNALGELKRRGLIRPVHARVHKGGKHQEYILARLTKAHRFATHADEVHR